MSANTITVPDLGGINEAEVVEILCQVGDRIESQQPVCVLESDKASLEVPSPASGTVSVWKVSVGQRVREGDPLFVLEGGNQQSTEVPLQSPEHIVEKKDVVTKANNAAYARGVYAGPGVRRLAQALHIDLHEVAAEYGCDGRISRAAMDAYIRQRLQGQAQRKVADHEYERWGVVERQQLSRVKKTTAQHMMRCWQVPQVTQFATADITRIEEYRQANKVVCAKKGIRLTPLAFILHAVYTALERYPQINASISADGNALLLKSYKRLGVAIETEDGLLVPVITAEKSMLARDYAYAIQDVVTKSRGDRCPAELLQGASFTVSSLGNIGGGAFTPIVSTPQVAILGVGKALQQPCWQDDRWVARWHLPLALSYDHRAIDGAEGLRFILAVVEALENNQELADII